MIFHQLKQYKYDDLSKIDVNGLHDVSLAGHFYVVVHVGWQEYDPIADPGQECRPIAGKDI